MIGVDIKIKNIKNNLEMVNMKKNKKDSNNWLQDAKNLKEEIKNLRELISYVRLVNNNTIRECLQTLRFIELEFQKLTTFMRVNYKGKK